MAVAPVMFIWKMCMGMRHGFVLMEMGVLYLW